MTPKSKLHRWFPHLSNVRRHPHLNAILGRILEREALWHFNRRCVARGVAVGLFWAFVPVPFQMVFSGFTAFVANANLPAAVISVWVSNPATIPPLAYFCYTVGQAVLGTSSTPYDVAWSIEWLSSFLVHNWPPLLLGCLIVGTTTAVLGYLFTRIAWNIYLRVHRRKRTLRS